MGHFRVGESRSRGGTFFYQVGENAEVSGVGGWQVAGGGGKEIHTGWRLILKRQRGVRPQGEAFRGGKQRVGGSTGVGQTGKARAWG